MRKLFSDVSEVNKPWEQTVTPEQRAETAATIKAYWESIYGPRIQTDFKALARTLEHPPAPPKKLCAFCDDFGYIKYNVPVDDPLFGKMLPCPQCEKGREITRHQWQRRYEAAELPRQYQDFTFASWDDRIHEEGKAGKYPAYDAARQFAEHSQHMVDLMLIYERWGVPWEEGRDSRPKNSLVFYGDYGTGKSGLMAAIINELLARGENCLYVSTHGIIEEYMDTYEDGAELRTKEVMAKYKTANVLFVDDFNIHNTSKDKLDKIEQIIRYRYVNLKPTLMTMNVGQDEFARMWADRTGVAAVAMAHWIRLEGATLRRADPPVNDEMWWQR